MPTSNELTPRDAALAYAAAGLPVFPCRPDKRPFVSGGFKSATTDPAKIAEHWGRWPDALIGMPTGEASGLFILDLDIDKDTGECTGAASLAAAGLSGVLDGAIEVCTPSGGRHVYFRHAGDLRNSAGRLGDKIDTRGEGGYVIVPGAGGYRWAGRSVFEADVPEVPKALRKALAKPEPVAPPASNVVSLLPMQALARQIEAMRTTGGAASAWAEQAMNAEIGRVMAAAPGTRNHTLNRAAFALGQIVAGGGPDRTAVEAALSRAARAIGLDEGEIGPTITSGLDDGAHEPRTAPERVQDRVQAHRTQAPAGPLFTSAAMLAGQPVEPRKWHVRDLVPGSTVTLLGGDGGTGKSLLALQLAVATALGGAWLHRPVEAPGRALFLTAEDELSEVHRRLADICAAERCDMARLCDLFLRSLAGDDALLAMLDRTSGILVPTPLFAALDAAVAELKPSAVFLDTLADLHSGDENNRAHARQFIGLIRGLAIRHDCAVVLLAHPSLSGMSSGSGLSGSTAWNGSVRSRLYLDRVREDGYEPDPDARRLSTKKANYGPTGEEIALRWQGGVFVADAPQGGLDRMAASAKAERVFLNLLRQFTAEGRAVNHAGGRYYAPKVFAEHPQSEGVTKRAFAAAMNGLLASGKIAVEKYGPPSKGATRIIAV